MGLPSKQKEAVIKYFKKSMTKKGKSEYLSAYFVYNCLLITLGEWLSI